MTRHICKKGKKMDRYQMNRQGMNCQGMNRQGYPYRNNRMANSYSMPVMQSGSSCPYAVSSAPVDEMPLTIGYVPMQQFNTTFELNKALQAGTIFPELCKPFVGKRGKAC